MVLAEPSHHYYPNFGLTIIKQNNYLFTLRHARHAPHQPTGHFHGDELAITLSVNGIPLFIDPGTYLYTAHPAWRNAVRAASAHTTVVPDSFKSIPHDIDLFQLPKLQQLPRAAEQSTLYFAQANNTWQQTTITRSCRLSEIEIIIDDTVAYTKPTVINWYWHLGPAIEILQINSTTWLLTHDQTAMATLHTPPLPAGIQTLCASKLYGSQKQTTVLCFLAEAQQGNKMVQQFRIAMMS